MTAKRLEKAAQVAFPVQTKPSAKHIDQDIQCSIRIQGIPEEPTKSIDENFVPTNAFVNSVLQRILASTEVTAFKRLGKFDKDRAKTRILLVTLKSYHEKRLLLPNRSEMREEFAKEVTQFFLETIILSVLLKLG